MVTKKEISYLRELAKKQKEYSALDVMKEREELWTLHNDKKGKRPMILFDYYSFQEEFLGELECESEFAKRLEKRMKLHILNHELIDDDKVVPDYIEIPHKISIKRYGFDIDVVHAKDDKGRDLGFHKESPIKDIEKDLYKLKPFEFNYDEEGTMKEVLMAKEIFDGILDIKIENKANTWNLSPSMDVVDLLGLENMMFAMYDSPDELHELYRYLTDNIIESLKWQEKNGLLTMNNRNHYAGAGSLGYTDELVEPKGNVTLKDIWGNLNSQETVSVSPALYEEFIYPYYEEISKLFGKLYYGCCEPVHEIWDSVSKYSNLEKVSISPWCNEEIMSEKLKGTDIIYSRKPSPNFIGLNIFDREGMFKHLEKTIKLTKDVHTEIIFRDIYTFNGELTRPLEVTKKLRELIETHR